MWFSILSACFLLTLQVRCESPPQDTLRNWMKLNEVVQKSSKNSSHSNCSATNFQSVSWGLLEEMLRRKKSTGILRHAWPTLDSWYTKMFRDISRMQIENGTFCGFEDSRVLVMCFLEKCYRCDVEIPAEFDDNPGCWAVQHYMKESEKQEINWDRVKEFRDKVVPADNLNADLPAAEELVNWMTSKFDRKENIQTKLNENCYASIRIASALKYLRVKFFDAGLKTTPAVKDILEKHRDYYWTTLRWLTGMDPSIITTCSEGMFCGYEGMWEDCKQDVHMEGAKGDSWFHNDICSAHDEIHYPSSEPFDREFTSYKSPRDAFRKWYRVAEKITKFAVTKNTSGFEFCSASVEQTVSWIHLKELFVIKKYKGGENVSASLLEIAWPRISLYEPLLSEVVKDGVADSVIFCDWNATSKTDLFCVNERCVNCSEIPQHGTEFRAYNEICRGEAFKPEVKEIPYPHKKEQVENLIVGLVLWKDMSGEYLLDKEAYKWEAKLKKNSDLKKLENCDAPPELTLSQKTVLRKSTSRLSEYEQMVNKKWLMVEDYTRDRKMCGDGLVCGPEGVCVPCRGLTVHRVPLLQEICEDEASFYKETEVFVRPAMRTTTGFLELKDTTTTEDSLGSSGSEKLDVVSGFFDLVTLSVVLAILN